MNNASIVLKGIIFDSTGKNPFHGAIAIKDNYILEVGNEEMIKPYIRSSTQILDYKDKLILPGFNDSHTHISSGSFYTDPHFGCDLSECRSLDEVLKKIKIFADEHIDNEWIFGYFANNMLWQDTQLPTNKDIDKIINNKPVMIQLFDLHTIIVNSQAMKKVGITQDTPQPYDGINEKDENGELTGRFFDGACLPFNHSLYDVSDEVYMNVYSNFFHKMKCLGITTVGLLEPFGVTKDPLPFFKKMVEENILTTRVMAYPYITTYNKESYQKLTSKYNTNFLQVKGYKQLVDGVTSVFTAHLLEPYRNNPHTCGSYSVDINELRQQVLNAYKEGISVRLHAIGDRTVREVLDIFEEAQTKYGKKDIRNVIEHLETVHPDDMKRFKELNVSCGMQPWHMLIVLQSGDLGNGLYGDKENAVGKERAQHSWPFKELWDNQAIISLGSDYPVVGIEPMKEIYAAVTRQRFDGEPKGGWMPHQKLTISQALQAYTKNSAFVEGIDNIVGTLEKGKLADIIILDKNLFEIEPKEILTTNVVMTMVDGKIIYKK